MESKDRLSLLEQHLSLAEAVARAVAYGSPSPVEEYRASINGEVLALREELDVPEHEEGSVEAQQDALDHPDAEEGAEATPEDSAPEDEAQAPEESSGEVVVDDEVHEAPVIVEPAEEHEDA